jgi:hypothetical protein
LQFKRNADLLLSFLNCFWEKGLGAQVFSPCRRRREKREIYVNFPNLHPKFNHSSLVIQKVYETMFHSLIGFRILIYDTSKRETSFKT